MPERDPRIDPAPGDVLRFPNGSERKVVGIRFTEAGTIVDTRPAAEGRLIHCWRRNWRKRAVKAEVLQRRETA